MIQPISNRSLQTGKYFTILKFMILQQNISTVWIFGDQRLWYQHGQEMNGVVQHLVGSLPKYIFNLNNIKATTCINNESVKVMKMFFVSQSFESKELNCICPTDYTMVLVENQTTNVVLPENVSSNKMQRIVFGTINGSTIADLTYYRHKPMEDLFTPTSLNLNMSIFRIFSHILPPNSMAYLVDNSKGVTFSGPDAQLSEEISKMLNATAFIQTDIGLEYSNFKSFFNSSTLRFVKIHKRILSSLAMADYYQNYSNYADLYVTSRPMKGGNEDINEFLYPLDKECLRFVVPRITTEQGFAEKLLNDSVVQYICVIALLLFISKIILNGSHRLHDWIEPLFTVLAAFLGQKLPKISSKIWETIWNAQLTLIVMISTAALSAISYRTLVTVKFVRQIDTVNDLIESDIRIFVEKSRSMDFAKKENYLDPRLSSKFVYQDEMLNFMSNATNDVAYLWDDRMAWVHVMRSQFHASDGQLSGMRLATETLYCRLSSPQITNGSPFKHSIDRLILRMFESGIRAKQLEWSYEYYQAVNRKIEVSSNSGNAFRPLTLPQSGQIFVLLTGGMSLSCTVFVLELLWNWFTMRKHKNCLRCIQ